MRLFTPRKMTSTGAFHVAVVQAGIAIPCPMVVKSFEKQSIYAMLCLCYILAKNDIKKVGKLPTLWRNMGLSAPAAVAAGGAIVVFLGIVHALIGGAAELGDV